MRQAGNPATETTAGFCAHVAINNTGYDNVTHHPSWGGFVDPPNTIGVRLIDISELIADGCEGITNTLNVLFTAAHPNLGLVTDVSMSGPGGPLPATRAGTGRALRHGNARYYLECG